MAVQGKGKHSELHKDSDPSVTTNPVREPKGSQEDAPEMGYTGKSIFENAEIEEIKGEFISKSPLPSFGEIALRGGQVEANPAPSLTIAASVTPERDVLRV